jgi:hypothetical protein
LLSKRKERKFEYLWRIRTKLESTSGDEPGAKVGFASVKSAHATVLKKKVSASLSNLDSIQPFFFTVSSSFLSNLSRNQTYLSSRSSFTTSFLHPLCALYFTLGPNITSPPPLSTANTYLSQPCLPAK